MSDSTHDVLAEVVKRIRCKPGWTFRLVDEDGALRLVITVPGYDSAGAATTDRLLSLAENIVKNHLSVSEILRTATEEIRSAAAQHREFTVSHFFPVPTATYNERTWRRWVFERCLAVENHEMGEWFRDGNERPFAPLHGPGEDPYTVHEFRPEADTFTTQNGSMRESYE